MTYNSFYKGIPLAIILFSLIVFVLFYGYQPTHSQASLEPVAPYFNGVFPEQQPSDSPITYEYEVVDAFPNLKFEWPISFQPVPETTSMAVGNLEGKIHFFANDETVATKTLIMDISDRVEQSKIITTDWAGDGPRDGAFMGFAFHPEFNQSGSDNKGYIYVSYLANTNLVRLSRFNVPDLTTMQVDNSSELVMIEFSRLGSQTHYGGTLDFGKDGFLYFTFGELGGAGIADPTDAQNISDSFRGGSFRIDVDKDPAKSHAPRRTLTQLNSDEISGVGYWIPNDNPFLDESGGTFEEYYSLGHRNPWKMTIDEESGQIWVAEVGPVGDEEVNFIQAGGNYGWPYKAGDTEPPILTNDRLGPEWPSSGIIGNVTDAAYSYDRIASSSSVVGGEVYTGSEFPELAGRYIFSDIYSGNIWGTLYDADTDSFSTIDIGSYEQVWAYGKDHDGEIFFTRGYGYNNYAKKLSRAEELPPQLPSLLSDTGAFTDLANLTISPAFIPYQVNAPFYSDNASKYRWMAIPNDGVANSASERIKFSKNDAWDFPEGTVIIKHFEFGADQRLETRFMVHGIDGWYGFTYKWLADGSDAELVDAAGLDEQISVDGQTQTWTYPSRAQCMQCHTESSGQVLGLNTRQLNGNMSYPTLGQTKNQLIHLNDLGLFAGSFQADQISSYLTSVDINDTSAPLEDRVLSYLDSNCAMCHNSDNSIRAAFDARLTTPLDDKNLIDQTSLDDLGVSAAKIVSRGNPDLSTLYLRLSSLDSSIKMPPLSKNTIDTAAVSTVHDWIESLAPTPTPEPTATQTQTPTPTATNTATATQTETPTSTAIETLVPTATQTAVPTGTPSPIPTQTAMETPTGTQPPTAELTATATIDPTKTGQPTPVLTPSATAEPNTGSNRTIIYLPFARIPIESLADREP